MNLSVGDILTSPRNPNQQSPPLNFTPTFNDNDSDVEDDSLIALSKRRAELMASRKEMMDRIDNLKKDIKSLQSTKVTCLSKRNSSISVSDHKKEEPQENSSENDTAAIMLKYNRLPSQDWDKRLSLISKFCSALNVVDASTITNELHFGIDIDAVGKFVIHLTVDQDTKALTQFDMTFSDVSSELALLLAKKEALGPCLVIYSLHSFSQIRKDRARVWHQLWAKYGSMLGSPHKSDLEQRIGLENSKTLKLQRGMQELVVIWSIAWDWDTFTGDCESHFTCILSDGENHQNITNTLLNLIKVQGIVEALQTLIENVFAT